jgi:hypothetical protein
MKAGGVKFADTPDEAAAHAADILELEISGHMPVGVLVDPKAEVEQEYYAAVLWDGRAKRPMMLFSDMGGIDIEEVAEKHPDHVVAASRTSTISTSRPRQACPRVLDEAERPAPPDPGALAQLQRDYDMTRPRSPGRRLADGPRGPDAPREWEQAVGATRRRSRRSASISGAEGQAGRRLRARRR